MRKTLWERCREERAYSYRRVRDWWELEGGGGVNVSVWESCEGGLRACMSCGKQAERPNEAL